ncbi:hypothetical protein AOQ84DRAFT_148795 [Glonium stellatum]|uniref:Cytochrome P450 n=1 Tax=Glonium stellatum TaxID=574774 RepID=A0A8E2JND0_9PEZI|nr:hypothetical protein AOQ84DRAFT_148795 [Glonium stellatum]
MDRWFWAFGSGGRMCVGSHLAMYRKFGVDFVICCSVAWFCLSGWWLGGQLKCWLDCCVVCCRLLCQFRVLSITETRDGKSTYPASILLVCSVSFVSSYARGRISLSVLSLVFRVMLTKESEMKYIIAAIYSNYTTTIVDDTGIEQVDAYTAPPKNDKLIIRLERV